MRTVVFLVLLVFLVNALDRLTDGAVAHLAEHRVAFARVSPAQKNRIILALKARKHTVGYLGDGINDAPSLHSADVGISVSTAGCGKGRCGCHSARAQTESSS